MKPTFNRGAVFTLTCILTWGFSARQTRAEDYEENTAWFTYLTVFVNTVGGCYVVGAETEAIALGNVLDQAEGTLITPFPDCQLDSFSCNDSFGDGAAEVASGVPWSPVDTDSGAQAKVFGECNPGGGTYTGRAITGGSGMTLYIDAASQAGKSIFSSADPDPPCGSLINRTASWAAGGAALAKGDLDFNQSCSSNPPATVYVSIDTWIDHYVSGDSPRGGEEGEPGQVLEVVHFVSLALTWANNGIDESFIVRGVLTNRFDGTEVTTIRLGFFDDAEAFPGNPGGVSGEISIQLPEVPEGATDVSASGFSELFEGHDGDIDADGDVCPDDYDLMQELVNDLVEINAPGYSPRADFNLDGIIDSSDWDLNEQDDLPSFLEIWQSLLDDDHDGVPDACPEDTDSWEVARPGLSSSLTIDQRQQEASDHSPWP